MNACPVVPDENPVPAFVAEPLVAHPDLELLERLRSGNEDAFEELVRGNGARMLAVAQRMLRNEESAREVVQEAFTLAFRSLPDFEGRARLSSWLHRIVVNVALMRLRTERRHPEASIEDLLPRFHADGHRAPSDADSIDVTVGEALDSRSRAQLVRRCIASLPDSYRLVLVLRDIEERDTEETANLLGIGAGAVKVRLHRARQALKTLLQRELAGLGSC